MHIIELNFRSVIPDPNDGPDTNQKYWTESGLKK